MEIYQIIHFIAIVETGSFTKGADRAATALTAFSSFSEVAPAASDGCLRVPSGLSKSVQATFLSSGLDLCG
jgi:hypothetical protein